MYIDLLVYWNARVNLTAIRSEEEIVTRHFGESLFTARHLFPKVYLVSPMPPVVKGCDSDADDDRRPAPGNGIRVADLGSGAGFPGIPIKLWAPHIAMTLIESNHKKATFLREVVRSLTLTNIDIQNARAETLPPSSFEVITLRAVERLNQVLPVATNLLAPGGQLALLISSAQQEAIASILRNFTWKSSMFIPNSESRQLMIGQNTP
jgi:16S rRNA (guanine527-N7)-methyltransferase